MSWVRAAILLVAPAAGACCPRPWPKGLQPISEAGAVLRSATSARAALRSLSASARVDAFTREGRVKVRVELVADRTGRLRFDTLSPFEQPISTLVSDGRRFALYDLPKKRFYTGPATPRNISRILPIRLTGEEVAQLLLGDVPLIAHERLTMERETCKTRYRLTLLGRDVRQEVAVDAISLLPVAGRLYANGSLVYDVSFERHEKTAAAPVPRKIRFRSPRDRVDLLVLYGDVEANPRLQDDLFRLEAPRGAVVIPTD